MNQEITVFITPFALMLGCGLLAFGGLFFIDIKYLKDRTQAVAALLVGSLIIGVLEIVLATTSTAFYKAQEAQTSACELEGESAHPEERQGGDPSIIHKHIVLCMKESGYEWTTEHRHCKDAPVASNPFCYLPVDAFTRAITGIQLRFE